MGLTKSFELKGDLSYKDSSYREFRVIESQMLGWVALGADEIVRVKGRFEL